MAEEAPVDGVEGGEPEVPAKPLKRITISKEADDVELTEGQLAKAKKLFAKHDVNGSGDIDRHELLELLRELKLRLDDEMYESTVDKYWSQADEDVSGTINFEEFSTLYAKVVAPTLQFGGQLRTAAGRGDLETIANLIRRGCNPNAGDGQGWTAVHHAAEFGRIESIKLMQKIMGMDLDIDAPDKCQWTPLFNAASNGHVELVRYLVKAGADVNSLSDRNRTVLHVAACNGKEEVVRALINLRVKINAQDTGGWTALHQACLHSHYKCIRALVEAGADRTLKDQLGYTMERFTTQEVANFIEAVVTDKSNRAKTPRTARG